MTAKTQRLALALIVGAVLLTTASVLTRRHQVDPDVQRWQNKVEATADDPTAARPVMLDAIYADRTFVVLKAYAAAYREKPWRATRIANFAHASVVADTFASKELNQTPKTAPENYQQLFDLDREARRAVKSIVLPPDDIDIHTDIDMEDRKNFQPTRIADAWLAWGYDSGKDGYAFYQKALRLDPKFGEVYYDMIQTHNYSPPGCSRAQKHAALALCLSRAETLEPKLHALVTFIRFEDAEEKGNSKAAAAYLREYLRLWPNAFDTARLHQILAQLEAGQPQKHDT